MHFSFGAVNWAEVFDTEYARRNLLAMSSTQTLPGTDQTPATYRKQWIDLITGMAGAGFWSADQIRAKLVAELDRVVSAMVIAQRAAMEEAERLEVERRAAIQREAEKQAAAEAARVDAARQEAVRQQAAVAAAAEAVRQQAMVTITPAPPPTPASAGTPTAVTASALSIEQAPAPTGSTQKLILLGVAALVGGYLVFKRK